MESSIIVKNLPAGVYVTELSAAFGCFGNIVSATVQAVEAKPISEAFIAFENSFGALQAVTRMNNSRFRGRLLMVLMSNENEHFKKVFVKNFSPDWDECDLLKVFEDIGMIDDAKISEDNRRSNGYGYIVFKTHTSAKNAVARMNGLQINGHTLKVERFKSRTERQSLMTNSLEHVKDLLQKSVQYDNLHVKNIPADMTDDEFKKLFDRYGEISSTKLMTDERGVSRGFGFVSFVEKENAARALEVMNGYSLKGKKLQINFKEDGQLRKQYVSLKNKAREVQIKQYKQRSQSVPKLIPGPLRYRKF